MDTTDLPHVRYSIGQEDFDPEIGMRLRIYVNGVKQKGVVEYDCEAGTVLRNVLDANGRPQLTADKSEVLRENVTGNVTVEWADV